MKPRLIPVLLAAAVLLLGLKISDVWSALDARAQAAGHPAAAQAPATPAPATPAPATPAPAAPAAGAPAANTGTDTAAAEASPDDKSKDGSIPAADPLMMSPSEIEVLQKLSDRRSALDRRAQDMSQQEVVLKAAEKRIDDKLAKLQSMEQQIGGLVDQQKRQGDERLKGLVKIYETMKPREAARIFEELDTPTVLDVLDQMKEAKAAPILAAMDPLKAKSVTAALIARRKQTAAPPTTLATKPTTN